MKKLFIESLIKAAVIQKDFMPLEDQDGNISINAAVNVLVKSFYGSFVLVELIDADALTEEEIKARLAENGERLEKLNLGRTHTIFEVFIFEQEPSAEKLEIISANQVHEFTGKRFLKCISVDLSTKNITRHFKAPASDWGISKLLNMEMQSEDHQGTSVEELKAILEQKAREYSIDFKADKPIVTYVLIAINILVWGLIQLYALKTSADYGNLLSVFGQKDNFKILSGEYWRFVSPIFLHANIVHLAVNCYSLYVVGVTVEKIFGHLRFTFIYLIAGITGNIASFMFSTNPAVGASGAIFGLMGALLYLGLERPALFKKYFGAGVITTIAINLFYGFSRTGIDNFAHMGGLVGGFLSTGIVNLGSKSRWYLNRYLYLILIVVLVFSGLEYGFNSKDSKIILKVNELQQYVKDQKWSDVESTGEEILSMEPRDNAVMDQVLWSLSWAEGIERKYEKGVEYAKQLKQIDPQRGNYVLGLLYFDMKQYSSAKEALQEAKRLNAGYSNINDLLDELNKIEKSK